MKIALSAETTVDLTPELLDFYHVTTVPYTLILGEEVHFDGEIKGEDLFAYTAKTGKLARTSAVNQEQFRTYFKKLLETNDEIIHFSLSSEMSSSFANGSLVAKEFGDKVHMVDSRTLSSGIALQVIYTRKLIDAGKSVPEILEAVAKRIPFTQASFGLEAVNYLYKGGRCSALSALGANILHIRPQIIVKDGKMISGKKYRGDMAHWTKDYVETTLAEYNNPDHAEVFITYSSAPDEIVKTIEARLKQAGFQHIMHTFASGTVSCHCGPHTLGILYFNDGDHPID